MNETTTVRALLDLENTRADVLFERVAGSEALLWPLARWPIASALASAQLRVTGHSAVDVPGNKLYFLRRMIREALPNGGSSDRLRDPVNHLFVVTGTTRTTASRGVGNWLSDRLAESLEEQAVVVQDAAFDRLTPRSERPANPRTRTFAPALARVRDRVKTAPPPESATHRAEQALTKTFSLLGAELPEAAQAGIRQQVTARIAQLPYVEAEFSSLLDRVRPRRIYMQSAAYGERSNLIRIAHERGIEVAELQHGWIGASHAAYNYGAAFTESELTSSLPDTLLTFGEYWGRSLRFPGRIVPIGKPLLEEAARSALPYRDRSRRLLLVSSVYERERLVQVALSLRRLLPSSWSIALRPHPSEQADATELFAEALAGGVILDEHLDVNASVASSRAVVGMVSTVLFEALPFRVHIAVIETDLARHYAGAEVFPQRLDGEISLTRFTERLVSGAEPAPGETAALWQPDSVARFLEFAAR